VDEVPLEAVKLDRLPNQPPLGNKAAILNPGDDVGAINPTACGATTRRSRCASGLSRFYGSFLDWCVSRNFVSKVVITNASLSCIF
jgi:hypothetical protein